MNGKPEIVPAMKVGAFLDAFPELEEALVGISPQFQKLRNPVLRRTVAKVVTIRQAANTGNVPVEALVNTLREAAGQAPLNLDDVSEDYGGQKPAWLAEGLTVQRFDATETINDGGVPLPDILAAAEQLVAGAVLELVTPILPSPVIDQLRAKGFLSWTCEEDGSFSTFLLKG
jgi:hypothetical protein